MAHQDVKVVKVCSVAPPQGSPMSLPLTFFDIRWLRFPPLRCLFFYQFPHPPSSFFDSVLPKLKRSFTLVLQHYAPLAGNLTWPHDSLKPIINYVPGDAVSLTVAQSHASFNHLSSSDIREAFQFHPLTPHLTVSHEQAAVLALQVTLFPNSGFSIGITIHHAVMDGKSAITVMKLWAYLCSNLEEASSLMVPQQLVPFYDRTVIRDPIGIYERFVNEVLNDGGPNNRSLMLWNWDHKIPSEAVRGTFELAPSDIENLKRYVQSKLKKKAHVSTFSVTYAYVGSCLVKAEQTKAKKVNFSIAVECRARLDPQISPSYFGNCLVGQVAVAETKSLLGNDGLVTAVEAVGEALSRLEMGLQKGADSWASRRQSATTGNRVVSISGSSRFEVYSIDFGWGKPVKVDITSIDRTRAISLSESRNGHGGVEIGLVLNKQEMEAFAAVFVRDLESLGCLESALSEV